MHVAGGISRFSPPFLGLRPFGVDDAPLFFGREQHVDELLSRLEGGRFVAIVGESGSGKSSLIRAGVLPALYRGFMPDGRRWRSLILCPGNDPIGELAASLSDSDVLGHAATRSDANIDTSGIEATLRASSLGLVDAVRESRMQGSENLILVVDQFEELFRFSAREGALEDEAAAFVQLLLNASADELVRVYVVLTVRADFLGDCARFRGLAEAINSSSFLVPRLTRESLQSAIVGPLAVCGIEATPRLVQQVLNEADDQHPLPKLQHALMRTWSYWTDQDNPGAPIDVDHYRAVGGMADALARHADEALHELSERRRAIAARVFKSLTGRGADGRQYRRPTRLAALAEIVDVSVDEVGQVIDVFRRSDRAFLSPPLPVTTGPDSVIDLTHETLIANWPALRSWVDEEARSADAYRRLADTAVLYRQGAEDLLSGARLQAALHWHRDFLPNRAWALRYHDAYDEAMSFLAQSAEHETVLRETEERAHQQMFTRARRSRLALALSLAVVLVVLMVMSLMWLQLQRAQEEVERAREQLERILNGGGQTLPDKR